MSTLSAEGAHQAPGPSPPHTRAKIRGDMAAMAPATVSSWTWVIPHRGFHLRVAGIDMLPVGLLG